MRPISFFLDVDISALDRNMHEHRILSRSSWVEPFSFTLRRQKGEEHQLVGEMIYIWMVEPMGFLAKSISNNLSSDRTDYFVW